mmetsp:Transcript_5792/g.10047  ORF Transcript_5792/g.10047 Transcript_5792/m.10047 type:complete len:259 (-) Transcript_5792:1615-2391(-)
MRSRTSPCGMVHDGAQISPPCPQDPPQRNPLAHLRCPHTYPSLARSKHLPVQGHVGVVTLPNSVGKRCSHHMCSTEQHANLGLRVSLCHLLHNGNQVRPAKGGFDLSRAGQACQEAYPGGFLHCLLRELQDDIADVEASAGQVDVQLTHAARVHGTDVAQSLLEPMRSLLLTHHPVEVQLLQPEVRVQIDRLAGAALSCSQLVHQVAQNGCHRCDSYSGRKADKHFIVLIVLSGCSQWPINAHGQRCVDWSTPHVGGH